MPRRLFNSGTFRCGVYKRAAFILKIKIEENVCTQNHKICLKPYSVKLYTKHRDSKNDWRDCCEIEINSLEFSQLLTNLKILSEI